MTLNSLEVTKCCKNWYILLLFFYLYNYYFYVFIFIIICGRTCYGTTVCNPTKGIIRIIGPPKTTILFWMCVDELVDYLPRGQGPRFPHVGFKYRVQLDTPLSTHVVRCVRNRVLGRSPIRECTVHVIIHNNMVIPKQHLYAWEEEDNGVPTYTRAPRLETNVLLCTSAIKSLHFKPCGQRTFRFYHDVESLVPFHFATFHDIGEGY
jgi:hypothetical protein